MSDIVVDTTNISEGNATVRDYIELLKPRVMLLVVFTAIVGMFLAPGSVHPFLAVIGILCIAMAAGASGAINMWYEQDIDKIMLRTRERPLVKGVMESADALAFGIVFTVAPIAIMGLALNWTAAALLGFASFFYIFIYTIWLKRRTPQNIVIGGAAGAFPPMIGWAAVTGGVSIEPIVLFMIIFMWTPPHFWALALYKNTDYTKAKIPMMPVVAGKESTKRQMFIYTLLLFPIALAPYFMGMSGLIYLSGAIVLNILFVLSSWNVLKDSGDTKAKRMFGYSIVYLFMTFALLMLDGGLNAL